MVMEEKKTFRMMHFTPGKQVRMYTNGFSYEVEYVTVSGFELLVKLRGLSQKVPSSELNCEPTEFLLERK
jgi:hypothetical protein